MGRGWWQWVWRQAGVTGGRIDNAWCWIVCGERGCVKVERPPGFWHEIQDNWRYHSQRQRPDLERSRFGVGEGPGSDQTCHVWGLSVQFSRSVVSNSL